MCAQEDTHLRGHLLTKRGVEVCYSLAGAQETCSDGRFDTQLHCDAMTHIMVHK